MKESISCGGSKFVAFLGQIHNSMICSLYCFFMTLIELEQKEMICRTSDGLVSITSKGRKFVRQYDELINLIEKTGV